jgi:phospholipid/cholesterol/gamma-HCH transport system ATP-binding protein
MDAPIIDIHNLRNCFGDRWVHDGVDLQIQRGEIVAIVGGSGTGKTTILRTVVMLQHPTEGDIRVFGQDIADASPREKFSLRKRWGMLFQHGALFSSLTILQNVMYPLREFTELDGQACRDVALLKIGMSGLELEAANKTPAELSGGMVKRAALARAMALDPELLLLDEPTAGLDPKSASAFDELVLNLRDNLGLTIVMVTHDLDTLWDVTDKVAFLGEGKVLACCPMLELVKHPHPIIQAYFAGKRGQSRIPKT